MKLTRDMLMRGHWELRRARKDHVCTQTGVPIKVGEDYLIIKSNTVNGKSKEAKFSRAACDTVEIGKVLDAFGQYYAYNSVKTALAAAYGVWATMSGSTPKSVTSYKSKHARKLKAQRRNRQEKKALFETMQSQLSGADAMPTPTPATPTPSLRAYGSNFSIEVDGGGGLVLRVASSDMSAVEAKMLRAVLGGYLPDVCS